MIRSVACLALSAMAASAMAEPAKYNIDPAHTYPAFEADHMGGMSVWRGKFNATAGAVTLDTAAKSGAVDVTIDMASVDFGHDKMNEHARSPDIFDVQKFPSATYSGKFSKWTGEAPTEVEGNLTLKGVTRPVTLTINSFLCKPNPMSKKMTCGADAIAVFSRDEFGVDYGKPFGFKMATTLRISIEAVKAD
jgi:polyisoprenoid-binding protein YceI